MTLVPGIQLDTAVLQAARELAQTLQATKEWQEWRSAGAAFERDAELVALTERYRTLAERWRSARASGKALAGTDAVELAEVVEKTREHPLFSRQQRAEEDVMALCLETNQVISEVLGMDFASNAALPGGGGCCG